MTPVIMLIALIIAVTFRLTGREKLAALLALIATKGIRPLLKGRSQGRE